MINEVLAYLPANILGLVLLGLVFIFGLIFLFKIKKTEWVLYLLMIWLPLESLVLRYTPIDYFAYIKYFPEILLYSVFLFAWGYFINKEKKFLPSNILNKWFIGFVIVGFISLLLNWYNPFIWALGLRQILRFVLVLFLVLFLQYDIVVLKKILGLGLFMILLQTFFGFIQYISGGWLDKYLFSSQLISVGNRALLGGEEQFWTAGSRVFATMGRYDRLGSFLALGILVFFPWIYILKNKSAKIFYWLSLLSVLLVLGLTMSRASWLMVFIGVFIVGFLILKDKKVLLIYSIFVGVLVVYLLGFALANNNVLLITEKSSQTLAERIYEGVSIRAHQQSYEGYGRIFFIINTLHMVVPSAPLFGVGPGNYGGGVAAALSNTNVYDRLHLPFGIQNMYGQIDNSWFSLWGEYGTLGLVCWLLVFIYIIKYALDNIKKRLDDFSYALSLGVLGATIGIMVVGFFGPYFEFRSLIFYYWLVVGIMFLYNYKLIKDFTI